MKEEAVLFGEKSSLAGIITFPVIISKAGSPPPIIILNAGLVHRVGPNRLYVNMARRFAAMGFTVLRFDFSGVGDSKAREDSLPVMQSNVEEVRAAMDMLRKRIGAEHFILAGLCGGAGFSFLAARDDARVSRAILINVAFEEHPEIQHRRNMDFYWRFAFFNPRSWLRVLSGKSNYWGILKTLAYNVKRILFNEKRLDVEKDAMASTARDGLHSMLRRGVHLLVVYSEWDLGFYGFQAVFKDDLKQSASAGQLTLKVISKTDHTFTQLRAQRQLFQVLEDWLTPLVKP